MRPRSVVLLISAPAWRGSGTSFAKIAAGLRRAGHRAILVTAAPDVTARFRALGLPVRELPLTQTGWREALAVARLLREVAADLVLCDTPRDLRLGALATLGRRTSVVFRYNLSGRALPTDFANRLLWRRIDAVVFQSEYARERAHRTSPWMARLPGPLIPNGYDGGWHRPDTSAGSAFRARHGIAPEAGLVVSAAALFLDKGHGVALAALAQVAAVRQVLFLLCGAGAEREAIAAEAARLGAPARFMGLLPPEELGAALNAADVVLHPAAGELFPNVVAEAMACGRAVVGVDAGAVPELLGRDGAAGVLVPAGDAEPMAAAVAGLLDGPDRRASLGRAARARLLAEFPLERMERGYVDLVEGLTETSRVPAVTRAARQPA